MVRLVALLAAVVLLAGCASQPSEEPAPTAVPQTFTAVADNRIAVPLVTDTLHLVRQPGFTARGPDSYTDVRLPVPAFSEQATAATGATTERLEWRLQMDEDLNGLTGVATFWVDVRGTVLNNPMPLAEGCFWEFRFLTGDEQTGASHFAPCIKEAATVPEGVRELAFPFDLPAVAVPAGQTLRFELYTQDFGRAPDATVEVLTASVQHDSRVHLVGLRLPVPDQALLAPT